MLGRALPPAIKNLIPFLLQFWVHQSSQGDRSIAQGWIEGLRVRLKTPCPVLSNTQNKPRQKNAKPSPVEFICLVWDTQIFPNCVRVLLLLCERLLNAFCFRLGRYHVIHSFHPHHVIFPELKPYAFCLLDSHLILTGTELILKVGPWYCVHIFFSCPEWWHLKKIMVRCREVWSDKR